MQTIDILIFGVYFLMVLAVGFYFMRRNKNEEDYYVGGRDMGRWHLGLSVVATDVGGVFSIGLGGLGFIMGVSGSWLLFTGLIGAWISAVVLIPKAYDIALKNRFLTFPQLLGYFYNPKVALIAGLISLVGYTGFTSAQILAGAKLATAAFPEVSLHTNLIIMGLVIVVYTSVGGIKAVIYTDTIQWAILMIGLIFIGIPMAYHMIGGYEVIRQTLQPEMLSLRNVRWQTILNWGITIIPVWFVGMTLYQRIFAARSKKEAQKAWFIAGIFEYPFMAFMGVILGLFARIAAEQSAFAHLGFDSAEAMDPESGLPILLTQALPAGFIGLMIAAYFSAIMSTADSCLMAASGNMMSDIPPSCKGRFCQWMRRNTKLMTLLIGAFSLTVAWRMENVLELMLYSYSVLISGLFVPVIGGLFARRKSSTAALAAMIGGGLTTVILEALELPLPYELNANLFGISASALLYIIFYKTTSNNIKPGKI